MPSREATRPAEPADSARDDGNTGLCVSNRSSHTRAHTTTLTLAERGWGKCGLACGAGEDHFVSLCSVCFLQRAQYFDNFSFSALARLFLVVE